jgi:hypothetical protein
MTCPPEFADILLEIIHYGVLYARVAGWQGDAEAAVRETDHIHNLPGLLLNYSPQNFGYYWATERPCYVSHDPEGGLKFTHLWEQLRPHAEAVVNKLRASRA